MTLDKFLIYVRYTRNCPDRIHPWRWNAMLKWLDKFNAKDK